MHSKKRNHTYKLCSSAERRTLLTLWTKTSNLFILSSFFAAATAGSSSSAAAWTGCYFSDSKFTVELNAERGKCGNFGYENIYSGPVRLMARTSSAKPLGMDIIPPKEKRGATFAALASGERYIIDCFSADDQPLKCAEALEVSCASNIECPSDINSFGSLRLSPTLEAPELKEPIKKR